MGKLDSKFSTKDGNWTPYPNEMADDHMQELTPAEYKVWSLGWRETYGRGSARKEITGAMIAKKTGMGRRLVFKSLDGLETKGYARGKVEIGRPTEWEFFHQPQAVTRAHLRTGRGRATRAHQRTPPVQTCARHPCTPAHAIKDKVKTGKEITALPELGQSVSRYIKPNSQSVSGTALLNRNAFQKISDGLTSANPKPPKISTGIESAADILKRTIGGRVQ